MRTLLLLVLLAPDVVKRVVTGTLPRGLGISDMTKLPMVWASQ